jgi:hypothetical protein
MEISKRNKKFLVLVLLLNVITFFTIYYFFYKLPDKWPISYNIGWPLIAGIIAWPILLLLSVICDIGAFYIIYKSVKKK